MMDFLIYAIIGGIGLVLSLSILGNFIVWKRISYIGDSISHSSVLGISIAVATSFSTEITTILVCFILSYVVVYISRKFNTSADAVLVFNTQFALATGIILVSLFSRGNMLNEYLFGSILSLNIKDIIFIYLLSTGTIAYVYFNWDNLLILTVNEDIARSENINVFKHEVIFVFILSCLISFSIKFIGILLIPSLTVIPAIIANNIVKTPLQAVVLSFICASIAIILGLLTSIYIDTSSGALITIYLVIMMIIKIIYVLIRKSN